MRYLALLLLLILSISACDSRYHLSGFAYHKEEFRSPPGPEGEFIGYDYSATNNALEINQWKQIVSDLIDDLEIKTGLAPQEVYVPPHRFKNAFNNSYDYAVRKVLIDRGYIITNQSEGLPHIAYIATVDKDYVTHEDLDRYQGDPSQPDFDNSDELRAWLEKDTLKETSLRMMVIVDGIQQADARHHYITPAYGYEEGRAPMYSEYIKRDPKPASPAFKPKHDFRLNED